MIFVEVGNKKSLLQFISNFVRALSKAFYTLVYHP